MIWIIVIYFLKGFWVATESDQWKDLKKLPTLIKFNRNIWKSQQLCLVKFNANIWKSVAICSKREYLNNPSNQVWSKYKHLENSSSRVSSKKIFENNCRLWWKAIKYLNNLSNHIWSNPWTSIIQNPSKQTIRKKSQQLKFLPEFVSRINKLFP